MGLWEWFIGEPGGVWIIGIVSVLLLAYEHFQRARPKRLVVTEGERSSLLSVHPDFRDKIAATYEGVRVRELSQLEVVLSNRGNETITAPSLTVSVPDAIVLAAHASGEFGGASATIELSERSVRVKLPYVNSRHHGHKVLFRLVADGSLESVSFAGGGEGWSVLEAHPKRTRAWISGITALVMGTAVIGVALFGNPDFCGRDMGVVIVGMGFYGFAAVTSGAMSLMDALADRGRRRLRRGGAGA
jgi:hypothetical protein